MIHIIYHIIIDVSCHMYTACDVCLPTLCVKYMLEIARYLNKSNAFKYYTTCICKWYVCLYLCPSCFLLFSSFLTIAKSARGLHMPLTKLRHKYEVHCLIEIFLSFVYTHTQKMYGKSHWWNDRVHATCSAHPKSMVIWLQMFVSSSLFKWMIVLATCLAFF